MTDFKKKSKEELMKAFDEKKEELRAFRFDLAGSAKKNVKAPRLARRDVARIMTELNANKSKTV
ncbi:MAG: 50S ribosomal protein L29 [Candidatus Pacebacteria bacterium]|nr:50S ribosomal protein L29 [Candidatus Paceibacterota bacterium]